MSACDNSSIHIDTPGKIILSGEYAVVYGLPAYAMAINRYLKVSIKKTFTPHQLSIKSPFCKSYFTNGIDLMDCYHRISERYQKFLNNLMPISAVITEPVELVVYSVAALLMQSSLSLNDLPFGIDLYLNSNIPIGCGMGSSAACIMGTLTALNQLLILKNDEKQIYHLAHQIENLQHGHSSGIDIYLAQKGGVIKFQQGTIAHCKPPAFIFRLVNTGIPLSSTGECLSSTAPFFKENSQGSVKFDFEKLANQFEQALLANDAEGLCDAVKQNHRLLSKIGAVSQKVKKFIIEIEALGGSAKICGAGSVSGEACGIVILAFNPKNFKSEIEIENICAVYGYELMKVESVNKGAARVVENESAQLAF